MHGLSDLNIQEPVMDLAQFKVCLSKAKITKQGWLEVSDEIFYFLVEDMGDTKYIDYEGVRLYRVGGRKEVEAFEKLSLDVQHEMHWKEKRRELGLE